MSRPEYVDGDLMDALHKLTVAAYVVDNDGRIRWQNRGSIDMIGQRVGQHFARVVAPEDAHVARTEWARKVIGESQSTEYTVTLFDHGGRRIRVRASSAPLRRGGNVIGVFGVAYPAEADDVTDGLPEADALELTARQYEVLALLADGLGTAAIAERLGVAEETARNHIRAIFRQLDVHSRLEAVVRAYSLGLLQPRREE
jgi:PAS domain S-box-containing protein